MGYIERMVAPMKGEGGEEDASRRASFFAERLEAFVEQEKGERPIATRDTSLAEGKKRERKTPSI